MVFRLSVPMAFDALLMTVAASCAAAGHESASTSVAPAKHFLNMPDSNQCLSADAITEERSGLPSRGERLAEPIHDGCRNRRAHLFVRQRAVLFDLARCR